MALRQGEFCFMRRPAKVSSRHLLVVMDCQGRPHKALTEFFTAIAVEDKQPKTATTYLSQLLPFFTWLHTDPTMCKLGRRWDDAPELVRLTLAQYFSSRLGCASRRATDEEGGGFIWVNPTPQSPSTVRVFHSAVKRLYEEAIRLHHYRYANPLLDGVAKARKEAERQARRYREDGHARMSTLGGTEEPVEPFLSENYFRLATGDWIPKDMQDDEYVKLLAAAEKIHLSKRDRLILRMAAESGARISEVAGLTVGDWRQHDYGAAARAFNKGSRMRRVRARGSEAP